MVFVRKNDYLYCIKVIYLHAFSKVPHLKDDGYDVMKRYSKRRILPILFERSKTGYICINITSPCVILKESISAIICCINTICTKFNGSEIQTNKLLHFTWFPFHQGLKVRVCTSSCLRKSSLPQTAFRSNINIILRHNIITSSKTVITEKAMS